MKKHVLGLLAGSSLLAAAPVAMAQPADDTTAGNDDSEIVVTARRREELLQDVPLVVNAVSGNTLQELSINRFEQIEALVPGLTMQEDTIATNVALRGVNFDTFASGNNGTVEFYLDDAPIQSQFLLQAMYDLGQVEVLRGPQGTLRGRASPSGSITVTTRRPDLEDWGGYISGTADDGQNVNGAVNIPVLPGQLGIRISGLYDTDDGTGVRSINNDTDSETETRAGRLNVLWEPTDSLSFSLLHQRMVTDRVEFTQVESANIFDPTQPAPAQGNIVAGDRLAVQDTPLPARQEFETTVLNGRYYFAGQVLNYTGSRNWLHVERAVPADVGDFFGPAYNAGTFTGPALTNFGQNLQSTQESFSHELRLSSDERLFGVLDYVVGVFDKTDRPPSDIINDTLIFIGTPTASPAAVAIQNPTVINRRSNSEEMSFFGNVNWHISDATELSAGVRHIEYEDNSSLIISGAPVSSISNDYDANIYTVSLKHNLTDNFMVYASTGTSWRPGINAVGDFSLAQSTLEQSFLNLPPEESTNYEIGFKSDWFDNRVVLNVTAFHQEFDNFVYRSAAGVFYVETVDPDNNPATINNVQRVNTFNFVAAVPAEVDGVEVETSFQILDNWDLQGVVSWASGEIQNGFIPCNDYAGGVSDGVPDAPGTVPTVGDIQTATGGGTIAGCNVTQNASFAPEFSASFQSEYTVPIADVVEGFVRGQISLYGETDNDPTNPLDDVDSYEILNLYAGVRAPDNAWELMFFVKNATDTEEVLTRNASPLTVPYRTSTVSTGDTALTGVSTYRAITMTPEQQFGVSLRYALGSR